MQDGCQIVRGARGNGGDQVCGTTDPLANSPQVSAATAAEEPKLPKLRAQASSLRDGRPGLLWSTTPAAWRRPVGVQRDIRVRDRSAHPTPWLAVVG
jgi:hypothetical protein